MLGDSKDPEGLNDQRLLRRRLAELLLEQERYDEALVSAEALGNEDPTGLRVKALASVQEMIQREDPASIEAALASLESAVLQQPADIGLATAYAQALRQNAERTKDNSLLRKADDSMDQMVAAAPNAENAEAWLARHGYRVQHQLPGADDDLRQALRLAKDPKTMVSAGAAAVAQAGRAQDPETSRVWLEQSVQVLQKASEAEPPAAGAFLMLGEAFARQTNVDQAIQTWEQGLKKLPADSLFDSLNLRMRLASTLLNRGETQKAREHLDQLQALVEEAGRLLSRDPGGQRELLNIENTVEMLNGNLLLAEDKTKEAIDKLSRLLDSLPATASDEREKGIRYDTLNALGRCYQRTRQWSEAATAFDGAAELSVDQGQAATQAGLACARPATIGGPPSRSKK